MSDRTASRLSRILAMLPWVLAHPGVRVDEVCARFGYTRRELLTDLDLVFVCGLPGYGPGDLMVAIVEDDRVFVETADYFAGAPRLTAAESVALLAAGMAVLGAGQGSEALAAAIGKLTRSLLPGEEDILTVELAGAEPELTGQLRQAASAGQAIEIVYTSLGRGETTTRVIEPWTVFTSLGNWYMTAHCRSAGGERVFRLDRVRSIRPTDERFTPPTTPPPPEVRYTPSEDDVWATIELDQSARWVLEYYPVELVSDGERPVIRFASPDPSVAAGLLLRLGGSGHLLEGEEVGRALADLAARVLARHGQMRL